ncbi:MAG TPA: SLBB domain-containing protein [Gemmataceae bacterium]|nr:SLBB domain-containing protein [Gemmataceae bacterium]
MRRQSTCIRLFWVILSCAPLLTGCTARPGSLFGLTQEGQRLLPATKELRQAVPEPAPLPRELDKALAPPYIVEPGDVLLVQPAKFDSPVRLPGDQPVLPDGSINLGQYGRLIAAGKTVEQIEAEARGLVEAQTRDAGPILVRIVSRQSKVFYVLGEVNAPGAYPLAGRETVLDALLAAGGVTNRANLRGVTLSRPTPPDGCRVVLPICYEEIVQIGDTSTNYQIAAGDRVFVPAKGLFDGLYHKSPLCPPCGRSQVSCFVQPGVDCPACRPGALPASPPRYQSATPPVPARVTPTFARP